MTLHFNECESTDGHILYDLARYKNVAEYVSAYSHAIELAEQGNNSELNNFSFNPSAVFAYKNPKNNEWVHIIENFKFVGSQADINYLKHLPARFGNFNSDSLVIQVDAFERECYISWN